MKAPFLWGEPQQDAFRRVCSARWGFRYKPDDTFTLRDLVERAYHASDAASVDQFAQLLEALPDSDPEIQAFIGQMVVGETMFFRNQAQFAALSGPILSDLIEDRRRASNPRLRIWSAGCSSGEEPYSLAILLAELVPDWADWDIRIFGTDINPFALRRATEALYSDWSFRETDPAIVARYFTRVSRLWRLDHPCRSMVEFRRQNLATETIPNPEYGLDQLDIVLCRNVTIYFDRVLTERLVNSFYDALTPGGWLIVGHTEPDTSVYDRFEAHEFPDTIIYRVPPEVPTPPSGAFSPIGTGPLTPQGDAGPVEKTPPGASLADAFAAYEAHDLATAFEMLHIVARARPTDPIAPHMLAQISADEKRYDEALYWAYTALQCDAFHVPTLVLMGLVCLERGDAERARVHLQEALFNDASCPEAHLYLSMAHRALGREDLATRSRERAAKLARDASEPSGALLPVQRARLTIAGD